MSLGLVRTSGRDLRIDLVRGFALWFIFIDHAGNNALEHLTLGRFALCDGAEVFVLLSGLSSGLAYGSLFERFGWRPAATAAIRRACVIYMAYLGVFALFGLVVWGTDTWIGSGGSLIRTMRLDLLAEHPVLGPAQVFLMRFTPYTMDVLPLYVALLAILAAALPLVKRPFLLLGASTVVYLVGWRFDLNLPTWDGGGWGFDPLEWQVLFLIGVVLGDRVRSGRANALSTPRWLVVWSILFLVVTRGIQLLQSKPEIAAHLSVLGAAAHALQPFFPIADGKVWLHPLRLVSVLALAVVFRSAVAVDAPWLKSWSASPFTLMGQHSLTVFCAGVPLSFLTRVILQQSSSLASQIAVNVVGFATIVAVAWIAARLGHRRNTVSRSIVPLKVASDSGANV